MTFSELKLAMARIIVLLCLFGSPRILSASSITVGYLSFSADADGSNSQFSVANISDTNFSDAELDFRGQLGGFGGDGGNVGPHSIAAGSTYSISNGGLFQFGYIAGTMRTLNFQVSSVNYHASNGSFQQYLYSSTQYYLGPGQSERVAITVDAEAVAPEPNSLVLSVMGLASFFTAYAHSASFERRFA